MSIYPNHTFPPLQPYFKYLKTISTADNLSNAKPAVQQRHPGDYFPVSQRGSAKGKQTTSARV